MSDQPETPVRDPSESTRTKLFHWGPQTIERPHLFEAWHEAAHPLFDTTPVHQERSFVGGGTVAKMGDLILTEVDFSAQRFDRGRRHIADTNYFSLQLYTRGGFAGTIGDTSFRLAPDRIALLDFGHELHGVATEPSVVLGVSIPRDQLDTAAHGTDPGILWSCDSTSGRLLSSALAVLREDVAQISEAEAAEAAAGFIGLLNGLLRSRREVHDPRPAHRLCLATIERHIERHLHCRDLGAAALCRAFGSSRSRLYELFKKHGGVERYLRDRRLARCLRDLATADPASTGIATVAARWGFHDQSHFNRLFKQQFSLRPSDVLGNAPAGRANESFHHAELSRILAAAHQWFRSL